MADILETIMMICFGASWPINIYKLWKGKTTRGTSVFFYSLIVFGYVVGIASKIIKLQEGISTPFYVWFLYCLNCVMVAAGILVWFRNKRIEEKRK